MRLSWARRGSEQYQEMNASIAYSVGPPRRERGQGVEHCGLGVIEIGEAKHRTAVPGFGFLRIHAGGLPCRSMELPHNLLDGGSADSVSLGDLSLPNRVRKRVWLRSIHKLINASGNPTGAITFEFLPASIFQSEGDPKSFSAKAPAVVGRVN